MKFCRLIVAICTGLLFSMCGNNVHEVDEKWCALQSTEVKGLLGERLGLWRDSRLWFVADSGFLLSGFENRPGIHPWQGEHVGKWLHAATLAYLAEPDEALKNKLEETVDRLIATQLQNGYMGTYAEDERFYVDPGNKKGWDVWTHRYNLYGLLTYAKYFPDDKILEACRKMGDLLIATFGQGKADITRYGTRNGMSSSTLLESMAMLYEATGEERYLDFAGLIVEQSEENPGLRIMGAMLEGESVVGPGEGKAYQLMSNLLGYYRLYLCTGGEEYLRTTVNGWKEILDKHILVTGGPWTRKMAYNANKECFAYPGDFHPALITVENCCTVTWIQLNLHLFGLTGNAAYAGEAERAAFNHLLCSQNRNGVDWCYYTPPNETSRAFEPAITCCASSGPRALEMYAGHLAGTVGGHLSINSLTPSRTGLPAKFGGGDLEITGDFPLSPTAEIHLDTRRAREFTLEFRIPVGTDFTSLSLNGEILEPAENERGFFEIRRRWRPGDRLILEMERRLQVHLVEGEGERKWLAFSFGPLVFAQVTRDGMELAEPFLDLPAGGNIQKEALGMLFEGKNEDGGPSFLIKETDIKLIPYFRAGSRDSGPRTYFEYGSI
jgi:DUF1680 family protein